MKPRTLLLGAGLVAAALAVAPAPGFLREPYRVAAPAVKRRGQSRRRLDAWRLQQNIRRR